MDIGSHLRTARERRQLTLDVLAARTKIPRQLLHDLEANDLSRWPKHQIYRLGFLRAYIAALGLDAEPIVARFLQTFPDEHSLAPVELTTPGEKPPTRWSRWRTAGVAALGVGLSVLLVLVIDVQKRDEGSAVQAVSPPASPTRKATTGTASTSVAPSTAAGSPADVPSTPGASNDVAPGVGIEGELVIESDPPDATVVVNGIGRGRTPARVQFLPLGSYTVRVVRTGYESQEQHVTLTATRPVRTLTIVLQESLPVSNQSLDR